MSSFQLQGAADPEHPNKHPGTPHPVCLDLHNFEEAGKRKIGRAAACLGQRFMKLKLLSLRMKLFVFSANADDENVKTFSKKILHILKKYFKLFGPFIRIQSVAHSESSNKL